MVEVLKNTIESDFHDELDSLKQEVMNSNKDPETQSELATVEKFSFPTDIEKNESSALFGVIAEQINGKKKVDELNNQRKEFNKDNRSITPLIVDGQEIGRQRVTSTFDTDINENLILKDYTTIKNYQQPNEEKIYETLATIKPFVYGNEKTLRIESNNTYDYDILFHYDGHFSVIQKEGKKNKQPKLDTQKWVEDFSLFLKKVFPPAYQAYYQESMAKLDEKNNTKDNDHTVKKYKRN